MAEDKGGDRRPTGVPGSSGSKGAGPKPVNPNEGQSPSIDDKDVIIEDLRKQVGDAERKFSETESKAEEVAKDLIEKLDVSSGRVGELEEQLVSVQAELRAAKADAGLFDSRIKELETRLTAVSTEKVKLSQELAAAKLLNPESEFPNQVKELSIEAGRLKTELDFTKKARAEAEQLVEDLKAKIEKIKADAKTELTASEDEAKLVVGDFKQEIATLRQQLSETRRKYYDALAEGRGLSGEYLKQIETLKQELAAVQIRAERSEEEYETKVEQLEKQLADSVAGWYQQDTSAASNGHQPAKQLSPIWRLLGLFGKKE